MAQHVLPHALKVPALEKLKGKRIVLASNSPRRKEILRTFGLAPDIVPSTFEENLDISQFSDPHEYPVATATHKAVEVYEKLVRDDPDNPPDLVIGADTVVLTHPQPVTSDTSYSLIPGINQELLEKPTSKEDNLRMLLDLNGQVCEVVTGLTVVYPVLTSPGYSIKSMDERSLVYFGDNHRHILEAYADSGEGIDRAGGFAIQGQAGMLIRKIEGDYNNVVGFPAASFFKFLDLLVEEEPDFLEELPQQYVIVYFKAGKPTEVEHKVPDEISSFRRTRPDLFSKIRVEALFDDYRIQSNANNEITVVLSSEAVLAALRSASEAEETVIKLAKKNDHALLSFEILRQTRSAQSVRVTHDVKIEVMKPTDVEKMKEPLCPKADLLILLPPLQKLRTIVERLNHMSDVMAFQANNNKRLKVAIRTESVNIETEWTNCQHPTVADEDPEEERPDPDKIFTVLISTKSFLKFLNSHVVSTTTIAAVCQHHCVILYVYIGDVADAGGVLTYYIPAIIDDEDR